MIGAGVEPGTVSIDENPNISPRYSTCPDPANAARSTSTYSRVWWAGRAYSRPCMLSMTTGCDGPMPSTSRPSVAAWVDIACCAMASGWRGYVGITAVPSSMRLVT